MYSLVDRATGGSRHRVFYHRRLRRTVDGLCCNMSRKWYVLSVAWRPGSGWKINTLCWTERTNRPNCLLTFSFVHTRLPVIILFYYTMGPGGANEVIIRSHEWLWTAGRSFSHQWSTRSNLFFISQPKRNGIELLRLHGTSILTTIFIYHITDHRKSFSDPHSVPWSTESYKLPDLNEQTRRLIHSVHFFSFSLLRPW